MMDPRIVTALIAAGAAIVGGAIGSIVSPFIKGHIEKIKQRTENRKQRIQEWREEIDRHDSYWDFTATSTYKQLIEKIPKEEHRSLSMTWLVRGSKIGSEKEKLMRFHEVVNKIERKWKLI